MESHFVELGTEFHDLQPLSGVPSVLLRRVSRHAGRTLFGGGGGPAFSALESDHDPDALVFSHKDVAPQKRSEVTNDNFTSSTDTRKSFVDGSELRKIAIRLNR